MSKIKYKDRSLGQLDSMTGFKTRGLALTRILSQSFHFDLDNLSA